MLDKTADDINSPPFIGENCKWLDDVIESAVLVRFVFDTRLNYSSLQFLQQANLSPRTIYPDLEGLAKSMNWIEFGP